MVSKVNTNSPVGLGDDVLTSGAFVGCGALASLALSSPVGALGGAVIGGIVYLTGKPIIWASTTFLIRVDRLVSQIACYAFAVFATAFVAHQIGKSICLALPFVHVFGLTALTYVMTALCMMAFEWTRRVFKAHEERQAAQL